MTGETPPPELPDLDACGRLAASVLQHASLWAISNKEEPRTLVEGWVAHIIREVAERCWHERVNTWRRKLKKRSRAKHPAPGSYAEALGYSNDYELLRDIEPESFKEGHPPDDELLLAYRLVALFVGKPDRPFRPWADRDIYGVDLSRNFDAVLFEEICKAAGVERETYSGVLDRVERPGRKRAKKTP